MPYPALRHPLARLGALAALVTVCVALLLAFARRLAPSRPIRAGVGLANLGYALPGSVLAHSSLAAQI